MKKLLLLLLLSLAIFSCKRESTFVDVVDKGEKLTFEDGDFYCQIDTSSLDIYSYPDFIESPSKAAAGDYGDVKILNADTTLISVSKTFTQKIRDEPRVGEKLVLYLNDTTVLNSKILSVRDKADRYELNITPVPMEEVFDNLSMSAESDDYYNPAGETKSADNPNSWRSFVDERGTLHPAVTTTYDDNGQPIVIDHRHRAMTKGLSLGLDIKPKFPIDIKKDNFAFSVRPDIHIYGNVGFTLQISWFKLKKCEAYAKAGVDINFPISLSFSGEKKIPLLDKSVADKKQIKLFFVSIVPVIFNYTPGIKATVDLTFSGEAAITTGFKYTANAKIGTRWVNGKWNDIKEQNSKFTFIEPTFSLEAKANLTAMVGPYIEFGFYGIYFGEVYAGGYGEIEASAKLSLAAAKKALDLKLTCEVGVKAGVSFKLKILKWALAKWKMDWKLYKYQLLDKSWSIDLNKHTAPPYYVGQTYTVDNYEISPGLYQGAGSIL